MQILLTIIMNKEFRYNNFKVADATISSKSARYWLKWGEALVNVFWRFF